MREFCVQGDLDIASANEAMSNMQKWLSQQNDAAEVRIEISEEHASQVALQLFFAGVQAAEAANGRITFGPVAAKVLNASGRVMRLPKDE